jgi:hypothetical protein
MGILFSLRHFHFGFYSTESRVKLPKKSILWRAVSIEEAFAAKTSVKLEWRSPGEQPERVSRQALTSE